jgi:hypothetical protein
MVLKSTPSVVIWLIISAIEMIVVRAMYVFGHNLDVDIRDFVLFVFHVVITTISYVLGRVTVHNPVQTEYLQPPAYYSPRPEEASAPLIYISKDR